MWPLARSTTPQDTGSESLQEEVEVLRRENEDLRKRAQLMEEDLTKQVFYYTATKQELTDKNELLRQKIFSLQDTSAAEELEDQRQLNHAQQLTIDELERGHAILRITSVLRKTKAIAAMQALRRWRGSTAPDVHGSLGTDKLVEPAQEAAAHAQAPKPPSLVGAGELEPASEGQSWPQRAQHQQEGAADIWLQVDATLTSLDEELRGVLFEQCQHKQREKLLEERPLDEGAVPSGAGNGGDGADPGGGGGSAAQPPVPFFPQAAMTMAASPAAFSAKPLQEPGAHQPQPQGQHPQPHPHRTNAAKSKRS